MTLTFDTNVASFTHLVDCKYKLKFTGNNSFQNFINFHINKHTKAYATKFDLDVNWVKVK